MYSFETKRQYLYELVVFLNHQHALGISWDETNDLSFIAYRDFRLSPGGGLTNTRSWTKAAAVLKNFYNYAVERDFLSALPFTQIGARTILDLSKTASSIPRAMLTKEKWLRFLTDGIRGLTVPESNQPRWPERDFAASLLLISTGLRIGELSQLLVQDIELAFVRDGQLEISTVAKNEESRVIMIPASTQAALRKYLLTERKMQANTWSQAYANHSSSDLFEITDSKGGKIRGYLGSKPWYGNLRDRSSPPEWCFCLSLKQAV